MATLTLSGWKTTTITYLMSHLPLQTYEQVTLMVDSYLSSVGGWQPDDPATPTGFGQPANGATPVEAGDAIVIDQGERVYNLSATVSIDVGIEFMTKLTPEQSADDVIDQVAPLVEIFIKDQLEETPLKFKEITTLTGEVTAGGIVDYQRRRDILASVVQNTYYSDPLGIALVGARNMYVLDDLWNVASFYTQDDAPIVVIIRKYTDERLQTVDNTENRQYIINIGHEDYKVIGGVTIPVT